MKRMIIIIFLVTLLPSLVFAIQFSPAVMSINAGSVIQYDFDGTLLTIPVTISGTPAEVVFSVFTKDKAQSIADIRNGFLGWHYVNKVDTCIYMSDKTQMTIGQNTITWDGKDNDNKMVPSGEYTYYLWGFDNFSFRQQALPDTMNCAVNRRMCILEYDETGAPLTNPVAVINTM